METSQNCFLSWFLFLTIWSYTLFKASAEIATPPLSTIATGNTWQHQNYPKWGEMMGNYGKLMEMIWGKHSKEFRGKCLVIPRQAVQCPARIQDARVLLVCKNLSTARACPDNTEGYQNKVIPQSPKATKRAAKRPHAACGQGQPPHQCQNTLWPPCSRGRPQPRKSSNLQLW